MAIRPLHIATAFAGSGIGRVARIVALLSLACPLSVRADGTEQITLRVGERMSLGGYAPVCDDPSVAIITADGAGVLVGKGKGKTTCSVQQPAGRRVIEVVVLPDEAKPRDAGERR